MIMAGSEHLRFHETHGNDVILSRCRKRADRRSVISHGLSMALLRGPGSLETEVVYSHRPIQVGETVPLHFGKFSGILSSYKLHSKVFLGFTKHNPSTLSCVPTISELERLPGYWVSELPVHSGYRLQFSVDSLGVIHFSNSRRTWTGPRVGEINISLWAVIVVPLHDSVEFDLEPIPGRALNNAVPVSSPHRSAVPVRAVQSGADSIPSSSSRSRTLNQSETTSSSPKCIICCDKPADAALSPCGHMYTCNDCALDLWQGRGRGLCPTCRKKISGVLRVYRD